MNYLYIVWGLVLSSYFIFAGFKGFSFTEVLLNGGRTGPRGNTYYHK